MKILKENEETGCCKRFNPAPWKNKEVNFNDKLFIHDHVKSLFHIPLNYGKVMERVMAKIEIAGAKTEDALMLSDENSLWGSEIYVAVNKDVPGYKTVKIQGNYLSKVFEGPFSNMGKWIEEMKKYLADKGKPLKKLYFFYTTCPACAKAYGKNYTVLLAEV
ncbi:MAG: hypothetical protein EPN85_12390 [Bacteroidetes bacterium]|nr:MAG: hypothetical protein EPN85_12390 [Bacteroidota bacterium]